MSLVEQRDFILLALGKPFSLNLDFWNRVAHELDIRLGVEVGLFPLDEDDWLHFWRELWGELDRSRFTRLLVVCLDQRAAILQSMRDSLAWQVVQEDAKKGNTHLGIQYARDWDETDWAELFSCSPFAYSHFWRLLTPISKSTSQSDYSLQRKTVSGIVWEMRRLGLDADFCLLNDRYEPTLQHQLAPQYTAAVELPWFWESTENTGTGDSYELPSLTIHIDGQSRAAGIEEIAPVDAWVHVIVKKYLEGISFCKPGDRLLEGNKGAVFDRFRVGERGYDELLFRMEDLLPSEYRGKADLVSPNSMGSAKIEVAADGKVPWDKIWTSFCDLALAGGPPHRGKLLEAVSSQVCLEHRERYDLVVAEIERGIKLVTGLKTVRSESLGWVGMECDDQQMAAWLLRAIIVENVMVRREGNLLFLPAGPDFQLTKEIKNVITSVAKAVHYWRDH